VNKIVAICGTYKRSKLIPSVIAQWEQQKVSGFQKYLLIYDDAGEFSNINGTDWEIRSLNERVTTLGAKWDNMVNIAINELGATHIAVWDDDDIYGPQYLNNHMETFRLYDCDVSAPGPGSKYYHIYKDRIENAHATGFGYLHPSWAFTKSFYLRSGGYNRDDIRAFDTNFSTKTLRKFNWKKTVGEPNFGYCWFSTEYINSSPFEDCPMEIADREEKTSDIITEITPMMNERIKLLWKHFGW
jgi:hypothetical protein